MQWYEFQIGLFVEAETEQEALDKLSPLLALADKIDPEADSAHELVGVWTTDGPPNRPGKKRASHAEA